jgi:hypothetical protein
MVLTKGHNVIANMPALYSGFNLNPETICYDKFLVVIM